MAKVIEGWKACYYEDDFARVYESAIISEKGCRRYRVGKWTKPAKDCGPLCIFETEQAARRFALTVYDVLPCKAAKSRKRTVWTPHRQQNLRYLPSGTILADKVMLLAKESK